MQHILGSSTLTSLKFFPYITCLFSLLIVIIYLFSLLIFSSQSSFSFARALFLKHFIRLRFWYLLFQQDRGNTCKVHKPSKLPTPTKTIQVFSTLWSSNPVTWKEQHITPCKKLSKYKTTSMLYIHISLSTSWRLLVVDYSKSLQSSWQSRPQRKQHQDWVINSVHSSSLQFPISGNKIQSGWLARPRVACGAFSTHDTTTGHSPKTCLVNLQLLTGSGYLHLWFLSSDLKRFLHEEKNLFL